MRRKSDRPTGASSIEAPVQITTSGVETWMIVIACGRPSEACTSCDTADTDDRRGIWETLEHSL